MRDPRCWREVFLRGGMTMIMAIIAWLLLDIPVWVLLVPMAIAALTCFKWALRPEGLDEEDKEREEDDVSLSDML